MLYSFIIPVYNRPDEVAELLASMTTLDRPTDADFEVVIVEDGSSLPCQQVVAQYAARLDIQYYIKENGGQGFARNYGFERAKGDFFIVLDSDVLLPKGYLTAVHRGITRRHLAVFGGPDRAHHSFSPIQKAISYAMTSIFSTGGIRGSARSAERFRPRSFNMGISREAWAKTGGYRLTRMGEDIEYSIRLEQSGYKIGLIREAYVYHKRRTSLGQFYRQLHFFGRARINVWRLYPNELKLVHTLPALFVVFCLSILPMLAISLSVAQIQLSILLLYATLLFSDATARTKNVRVAILGVAAVFVQLTAYGIGFWSEIFKTN